MVHGTRKGYWQAAGTCHPIHGKTMGPRQGFRRLQRAGCAVEHNLSVLVKLSRLAEGSLTVPGPRQVGHSWRQCLIGNARNPCWRNALSKLRRWLGRQDSNLGMPVPKTGALPLGDAPTELQARVSAANRGLISKAKAGRQHLLKEERAFFPERCGGGVVSFLSPTTKPTKRTSHALHHIRPHPHSRHPWL